MTLQELKKSISNRINLTYVDIQPFFYYNDKAINLSYNTALDCLKVLSYKFTETCNLYGEVEYELIVELGVK